MVIILENPVKIAGIVISGQNDDIFNGKRSGGKQEGRLVQAFYLEKLLKGMAGIFFYGFADSISGHMAVREECWVISHDGREYPGQKFICTCGWQWMRETAHTLLCEPVDAVNHTIRCALDGSAYCRGYESVMEEHYAYYYVPDEDGMRHGKVCLDCGYREEELCSFTLEEAPVQEKTEGENSKEDQAVQGEVYRWCVCGNCMKQEAAQEDPDQPVVGEPPEAPDTTEDLTGEETASPETPEAPVDKETEIGRK